MKERCQSPCCARIGTKRSSLSDSVRNTFREFTFDVIVCSWQKEQYPSTKGTCISPLPQNINFLYIPSVPSRVPQRTQVIQFTQILAIYTTARFLLIFRLIVSILRVSQVDRPQVYFSLFSAILSTFYIQVSLGNRAPLALCPGVERHLVILNYEVTVH